MHQFHYHQQSLYCEKVSLTDLASEYGTPLYVYSATTIRENFRRLNSALDPLERMVCYAMKANSNLSVINLLAQEGSGFDIVSGGELYRVLKAGGRADRCTFAGVGKTEDDIAYALREGIYCFNVESEAELEVINRIAGSLGVKAPIAIRVNPNVDAQTHKYISTGKSQNKFGIGLDRAPHVYKIAASLPHLKIRGVQTHIGSQILQTAPFAEALEKLIPLVQQLKQDYGIEFFSFGGGVGIVYKDALASGSKDWWASSETQKITTEDYAKTIVPTLQKLGLRILFEPGRFLVGNAGVLLNKVLYIKETPAKNFVVVDGGMNDLIRPALYEGWHEIVPLKEAKADAPLAPVDIVGPVCESGDFFAQDRELPPLQADDLIALMSAGAYGFVMSSSYNSRPLLAEILVEGDKVTVARQRQTYEDLIQGEHQP
ncbi:MAG: diaminopimelate decarboxylase [Chthoniobacterales bacterium]